MSDPARNGNGHSPDYAAMPLGEFLEATAAAKPAPGGGGAAAVSVALAAALAGMSARLSEDYLAEAPDLAERADRLRERASQLASDDAEAYGGLIAARRLPRGEPESEDAVRRATEYATDVPLRIAEAAREAAGISARLATDGNPNLRGDAVTAASLAEAAARSAAELAAINAEEGDWRAARSRRIAEESAALARCAFARTKTVQEVHTRPPPA